MSHHSKVASIAFTGAAAVLTVGMAATQGKAATSWHVKNNGTPYNGTFRGKNNGGPAVLRDFTTGAVVDCKTADLLGTVFSRATGTSPKVGSITGASANSCTIGGTIPITVRPNRATGLHAVTYATSTGVTTGFLGTKGSTSALDATITGLGNHCKATIIASTVPASYHNATHQWLINQGRAATARVKSATSCGLFHTGDRICLSCVNTIVTPSRLTISRI